MIGKKRKIGKKIDELKVGDKHTITHIIQDRELLLYLGLTNDANPLYIQHDYASQTPYHQPIVPSVMLFGIVSSMVSMHLPGPGSHIVEHGIKFSKSTYHNSEVKFTVEITNINEEKHEISMKVIGFDVNGDVIMAGNLQVCPPYKPKSITASSLENFF